MSNEKDSGRYQWKCDIKEIGFRLVERGLQSMLDEMQSIVEEHNLHASDIPIPFIYETIDTGDIESFIAFCEKKEREANDQTV